MTTISQLIEDSYRESNLLAVNEEPNSFQQAEALRLLNRIYARIFGTKVGDNFTVRQIGQENITRPSGFPSYGVSPDSQWRPDFNERLFLNISAPLTIYLPIEPQDGARFSLVDAANNVATNNVTIDGNGRLIEGSTTLTLNTNGISRDWFFREDTADWKKVSSLIATDESPFPLEFDDYFILELAMRLNPRHGQTLDPQSLATHRMTQRALYARYHQIVPVDSEIGLQRMTNIGLHSYNSDGSFEAGR